MNFLFQLFELGNIDARGELIIATMTISKPPMTNGIFTSNYIAKISKRDNHTNHDYSKSSTITAYFTNISTNG